MKIIEAIHKWSMRKLDEQRLKRFGGMVGEAEVIELVLSYLNENTRVAGRHGSSIVFQQF